MRHSLGTALLCALAMAPLLAWLAQNLHLRWRRHRRRLRRRAHLAYQFAWDLVFGRLRYRRLTDQRMAREQ